MAGVLKTALDLPNDQKIEYLANLMEDAADFTFESAKVCHAVVLTTMEADKLDWFDTDGLDRIRRSKAQRHPTHAKNVTVEKTVESDNPSMVCKYYLTHSCNRSGSHTTFWFTHYKRCFI